MSSCHVPCKIRSIQEVPRPKEIKGAMAWLLAPLGLVTCVTKRPYSYGWPHGVRHARSWSDKLAQLKRRDGFYSTWSPSTGYLNAYIRPGHRPHAGRHAHTRTTARLRGALLRKIRQWVAGLAPILFICSYTSSKDIDSFSTRTTTTCRRPCCAHPYGFSRVRYFLRSDPLIDLFHEKEQVILDHLFGC